MLTDTAEGALTFTVICAVLLVSATLRAVMVVLPEALASSSPVFGPTVAIAVSPLTQVTAWLLELLTVAVRVVEPPTLRLTGLD